MGTETKIEWCDHTFNPWIGCTHAIVDGAEHPGCANCYAEAGAQARIHRSRGLPLWGVDAHRHVTSADYWSKPATWNRAAQKAGVRRRVFCASNADVFEDRRDLDEHREALWEVISETPWLDWLLLTKRPDVAARLLPWGERGAGPTPWRNVWIGTSVSDQRTADALIPQLLAIDAVVRFVSLEPQVGAVDLSPWLPIERIPDEDNEPIGRFRPATDRAPSLLDWIIVGGESGRPRARAFDIRWARSIRDQCKAGGVAYFLKQLGARPVTTWDDVPPDAPLHARQSTITLRDDKGGDESEWPEDLHGLRAWPEVRA